MSAQPEFMLISLPQGQLKGIKRQSIYEEDYYSFEGIPFAKPPIDELRFRAPVPAEGWTDIKDCTKCASKPLQKNLFTEQIEGSEDCLYLNVYAKTLTSVAPLPVMVFIYGGSFCMGEATRELYSPDYFMSKNIILVTFNYRLCSLGFLSLQDPLLQVPGNAGLKDQVLALRWIKQHISHFNGDANNVTLFGESAGAGSMHILALSEQARGLFHKGIAMSGTALNSWANVAQTNSAYRLAKYHGYAGENIDSEVLAYLQALEPTKLVNHALLTNEDERNGVLHSFGPTVEPYSSEECVIAKPLLELLHNAWSNDIPFMLGGTSFEGLLMYRRLKPFPQIMSSLAENSANFLPQELREEHTAEEAKQLGETLVRQHFAGDLCHSKNLFNFLDYYSYRLFWHGIHRSTLARLTYAPAATYLYRFDFDSPDFNYYRNKFCDNDAGVRGVAHGDDLCYLWFCSYSWKLSTDSAEYKTIQRMVSIWTAFAEKSNPNCHEIMPLEWLPLNKNNPNVALNINNDLSIIELPEKEKLSVWNSLYSCNKQKLY